MTTQTLLGSTISSLEGRSTSTGAVEPAGVIPPSFAGSS
jgi:hypothetical protein